jgi:hypothetical protein
MQASPDQLSLASTSTQARRLSYTRFDEGVGPLGLTCIHDPSDPLVDVIFVHGLQGGSFKTWRKKEKDGSFWPGEWLPRDPDFANVRIHTFGYNADWNTLKSNGMSVQEFGSSLHGSMVSSAFLNRGEKVQ